MTDLATRDLPVDLRRAIGEAHDAVAELAAGVVGPSREIYARAEHATLFGAYGGYDVGWRALSRRLDAIAPLVADSGVGGHVTVETVVAQASGDLAYTVAFERRHAPASGGAPAEDTSVIQTLRVTQIYQRTQGSWKLIHRHADPLSGIQDALAGTGWTQASST